MQTLVTTALPRLPVELLWITRTGRVSRVGATEEAWWRRRVNDHLTVEVPQLRQLASAGAVYGRAEAGSSDISEAVEGRGSGSAPG
jgi:hypothetical protein